MCETTQHAFICPSPDLTLEIFNKCRLRQKILPLVSQRDFVLLYSRAFPPDSVLACSRSNTNAEINQKSNKKTEPRKCKSETEGNIVPSPSPDNVDVSATGEGRSSSKSRHRPTTSSPASHSSSSSSSSVVQSVTNKNLRPRVELKPSKCTLHHRLKAADDVKHSGIIMSLSSPGISISGPTETTTPSPPGDDGLPVCEEAQRGHKETH